jgi:hypothetical protein
MTKSERRIRLIGDAMEALQRKDIVSALELSCSSWTSGGGFDSLEMDGFTYTSGAVAAAVSAFDRAGLG